MRLAVISDIHGNDTALQAVLADLEAVGGADLIWCLGDLAALGPRPDECLTRIREMAAHDEGKTFKVIGGNTDRYLVNGERMRFPSAKDEAEMHALAEKLRERDSMMNWAQARLTWDNYEFLKKIRRQELSKDIDGYGWVIGYHGIPGDDETNLLPDTPDEQAADYLLDREGRLAIGGHTHRQMNRQLGDWQVVNVGSVGLSFDQPGRAQYGIFMFQHGEVLIDLRAVPYDVDAVAADLQAVDFPEPDWVMSKLRPGTDT